MKFDNLTQPSDGISFWIFNVLIHINFARTLIWSSQPDSNNRTSYFLKLSLIERIIDGRKYRAIDIIIGPLKIMIGK